MSNSYNYVTIIGYNLTDFATEKYQDWQWTDVWEDYTYYQSVGQIQIFDNGASYDETIYFGYIVSNNEVYDYSIEELELEKINDIVGSVKQELFKLIDTGVINEDAKYLTPKIISFVYIS